MLLPPPPPFDVIVDAFNANHERKPMPRIADIFDNMTDIMVKQRYRMSKSQIRIIIEMLRPDLERMTRRHGALTVKEQVLVALRFYATGSEQRVSFLKYTFNAHHYYQKYMTWKN